MIAWRHGENSCASTNKSNEAGTRLDSQEDAKAQTPTAENGKNPSDATAIEKK